MVTLLARGGDPAFAPHSWVCLQRVEVGVWHAHATIVHFLASPGIDPGCTSAAQSLGVEAEAGDAALRPTGTPRVRRGTGPLAETSARGRAPDGGQGRAPRGEHPLRLIPSELSLVIETIVLVLTLA